MTEIDEKENKIYQLDNHLLEILLLDRIDMHFEKYLRVED